MPSEQRKKIAFALLNNKNGIGHIVSQEARRKIGSKNKIALKGICPKSAWKKGNTAWNKGLHNWMSEEGKERLRKANKSGQESRNWIDGRSFLLYPSAFNPLLKERIKQRDNYSCQMCGIEEKNYFEKLSIHHIDYNKFNCNRDNLITLCRSCNAKINAKCYRERATTIIGVSLLKRIMGWSELAGDSKREVEISSPA